MCFQELSSRIDGVTKTSVAVVTKHNASVRMHYALEDTVHRMNVSCVRMADSDSLLLYHIIKAH